MPRNHNPDSVALKATLLATSALVGMSGAMIAPALPAMRTHFSAVSNAALLVPLVLTLTYLLLSPNLNVWLMSATPALQRGRVLGGLTTLFSLGQFASPWIGQPLSQVIGIAAVFGWVGAALLLLGLALVAARQLVGRLGQDSGAAGLRV